MIDPARFIGSDCASAAKRAAIRGGKSDLVELLGMLEETGRRARAASHSQNEVSLAATCMSSDLWHMRRQMMLGAADGSADASEPDQ